MTDHQEGRTSWPSLVRQQDPRGCGVAALAMVMDCTYEEAWDAVAYTYGERPNLTDYGITKTHIERVLGERGYVWRTLYRGKRDAWLPEPFAPVHIVSVRQPSRSTHFVVLLGDGRVLDPLEGSETLALDHWPAVQHVIGIWNATYQPLSGDNGDNL